MCGSLLGYLLVLEWTVLATGYLFLLLALERTVDQIYRE